MTIPTLSGRWGHFDAQAKARKVVNEADTRAKHEAIDVACQADLQLRLKTEAEIRAEQETKVKAYFTRKRTVWLAAATVLMLLRPAISQAQVDCTTPALQNVADPNTLSIIMPWHLDATAYVVGVFLDGVVPSDTSAISTFIIPKSDFAPGAGPNCYWVRINGNGRLDGVPVASAMPYRIALKWRRVDGQESAWSVGVNTFTRGGAAPAPPPEPLPAPTPVPPPQAIPDARVFRL